MFQEKFYNLLQQIILKIALFNNAFFKDNLD
jgi:hypothetical protein